MRTCKFYSFIFLSCFGLFLFAVGDAGAFSFSGLEIKSKFGDAFLAEIQVLNDGKSGLQVEIGSASDYTRLGLERRPMVDNLIVDENLVPAGPGKQLVRIYSKKPLFYPSFEMVLKATLEGNSIIESFLLAVDFRTNLSIGIVEKKKKRKVEEEKEPPKAPSSLISSMVAEEPKESERPPQEEKISPSEEEKVKEELASHKIETPEIVEKDLQEGKPEEKPEVKVAPPEKEPEKAKVMVEKTKEPLPEPSAVAKPASELTVKSVFGDNLFKVAQKILKDKKDLSRAVAALWILNKEKFLHENMNFLEKGVDLDYTGLAGTMAKISQRDARIIIKKQCDEASLLKSMLVVKPKEEEQGPLLEPSLPGEMDPSQKEIQKIVGTWIESWEKEDLESYIHHYSTLFQAKGQEGALSLEDWKERKRKNFESQEGVSIVATDFQVRRERDHYQVSFFQTYHSDKISSFGLKSLDFTREEGTWKIFREGFQKTVPKEQKIPRHFPYVMDIGTFAERESALNKSNYLRRLGYSAYIVPMKIQERGNYYRVALDRFSTKEEADQFASILIRLGVLPNAVSLELPYALEVGAFDSESDAFGQIKALGSHGFSAYLHSVAANMEGGLVHKVLVGAYETRKQAENILSLLKAWKADCTVVEP
jgi:cell division septation protein DedD